MNKIKILKMLITALVVSTMIFVGSFLMSNHRINTLRNNINIVHMNKKEYTTNPQLFEQDLRKVSKLVVYEGTYEFKDTIKRKDWLERFIPKDLEMDLIYKIAYTYETDKINIVNIDKKGNVEINIDSQFLNLSPIALDVNNSTVQNTKKILHREYTGEESYDALKYAESMSMTKIQDNREFKEKSMASLVSNIKSVCNRFGYKNVKIIDTNCNKGFVLDAQNNVEDEKGNPIRISD